MGGPGPWGGTRPLLFLPSSPAQGDVCQVRLLGGCGVCEHVCECVCTCVPEGQGVSGAVQEQVHKRECNWACVCIFNQKLNIFLFLVNPS